MSDTPDFYVRCLCCKRWSTDYLPDTQVWLVCDCPPPLSLETVWRPVESVLLVVTAAPDKPSGPTEQADHVDEHEQV
jgi:hypothetical protein